MSLAKPKKLTKKERRIAVAKDVLKRMSKRTIKKGCFLGTEEEFPVKPLVNLQKQITTLEKRCEVCALGSCLLSQIRLFNKIEVSDIATKHDATDEFISPDVTSDKILDLLKNTFTPTQMCLIEAVFEMDDRPTTYFELPISLLNVHFYTKLELAVDFGVKFDNASERLTAIMKNLIANDGEFKP